MRGGPSLPCPAHTSAACPDAGCAHGPSVSSKERKGYMVVAAARCERMRWQGECGARCPAEQAYGRLCGDSLATSGPVTPSESTVR